MLTATRVAWMIFGGLKCVLTPRAVHVRKIRVTNGSFLNLICRLFEADSDLKL